MAEQDRNGERYRMIYYDGDSYTYKSVPGIQELAPRDFVALTDALHIMSKAEETNRDSVPVSKIMLVVLHNYINALAEVENERAKTIRAESDLAQIHRKVEYLQSLLKESMENGGKIERAVSPYYYRPTEYEADDKFYTTEEVQSLSGGTW